MSEEWIVTLMALPGAFAFGSVLFIIGERYMKERDRAMRIKRGRIHRRLTFGPGWGWLK